MMPGAQHFGLGRAVTTLAAWAAVVFLSGSPRTAFSAPETEQGAQTAGSAATLTATQANAFAREISAAVEDIRGLKFKTAVTVEMIDRAAARDRIKAQMKDPPKPPPPILPLHPDPTAAPADPPAQPPAAPPAALPAAQPVPPGATTAPSGPRIPMTPFTPNQTAVTRVVIGVALALPWQIAAFHQCGLFINAFRPISTWTPSE